MYIEGEKSQRTYKLNEKATVVVKTEKKGEKVYANQLILTISEATMEPLRFKSKEDIAKLIEEADLQDEQTDLFGPGGDGELK